jgi:hypothetical protein
MAQQAENLAFIPDEGSVFSTVFMRAVNRLGVLQSIHLQKKVTALKPALYPKVYRHFDVNVAMLLAHTIPLCTHSNVTQYVMQRSVLKPCQVRHLTRCRLMCCTLRPLWQKAICCRRDSGAACAQRRHEYSRTFYYNVRLQQRRFSVRNIFSSFIRNKRQINFWVCSLIVTSLQRLD